MHTAYRAAGLVALGLLLLGTVPSTATGQQTFHDPALGYSMAYDADCKFTPNGHKSAADKSEWYLECNRKARGQAWNLSLTVDMATTFPDARLIAQEMSAGLKRDIPGLAVVHDPTPFGPLPGAYTFDWTAPQAGFRMHGAQYLQLSTRQQKVYVFTASSPASMFAPSHQAWEQVLATFKFDPDR